MNANELRIGNIVEWGRLPFTVCSIGKSHVENEWWSKPISEIYAIPLTEEVLLKYGFKFDCEFNLTRDMFEIQKSNINHNSFLFYMKGAYGVELKYLHQLQNLFFALTGQELETTL